ncbi:hypothetical protein BH10PLA1_BH10PLA1_15880 [soil metagenome]
MHKRQFVGGSSTPAIDFNSAQSLTAQEDEDTADLIAIVNFELRDWPKTRSNVIRNSKIDACAAAGALEASCSHLINLRYKLARFVTSVLEHP